MRHLFTFLALIFLSSFYSVNAQNDTGYDITVTISNFESNDGKVFIGLYNSEENFLGEMYKGTISKISNNQCEVILKGIPDGTYAISVYHDENDNNKMDKGVFGIPKEDYGCSNGATGFMGPPKWEDAKFELKGKSINQHIKL